MCLYHKLVVHKGAEFSESEFVDLLKCVGKVAWETLQSGLSCLSEIIKIVGTDAFDIGLLIGDYDYKIVGSEMSDIYVRFPHQTIQEFLGAFYFLFMVDTGESIKSLLGSGGTEPIFMANPLFLYFCLYFLSEKQNYFIFRKREVYEVITQFIAKQFDMIQLDVCDVSALYPALNDDEGLIEGLSFNVIHDSLASCTRTTELRIADYVLITSCLTAFRCRI